MQSQPSSPSPQKQEQLPQPIIYPTLSDNNQESQEQFVVIDCQVQEQPLTQFSPYDLLDIKIKVIDYIYEKSYVVLSTETFIIKISQTQNGKTVQSQQSRNDSDLEWLRRTLQVKYPGLGVPVYRINGSVQNLTKEKIIVVEEFLGFLIEHPVLKYSPEVKAFVSEKLSYLESRKEIDDEPIEYVKNKSNFELKSLLSVLKPWTRSKSEEQKHHVKIPNIKLVIPKQTYFRTTIVELQKLIQYSKKCNQLNRSTISSQKLAFKKSPAIPEFQQFKDTIKNNYLENQKIKQNQESLEYLRLGIKTEMVKQNMHSHLEWFDKIRKIQESIFVLKEKGDHTRYSVEMNYLKLLVNNMLSDMTGWTEYNNSLVQDSFYEL